MRFVCLLSLMVFLPGLPAMAADAPSKTIDVPCQKNLADGRVLVDGPQWEAKMRALGYTLPDGAYVPYEVLSFAQQKAQDTIWAEGLCHMKLLPVAR